MTDMQKLKAHDLADYYGLKAIEADAQDELENLCEAIEFDYINEEDANDIVYETALIHGIAIVEIMLEQLMYLKNFRSEVNFQINVDLDRGKQKIGGKEGC